MPDEITLYAMARGFGTQCHSGDDTLFKVVCGLVEYCANFCNAKAVDEVKMYLRVCIGCKVEIVVN